jgi:catechol 2,3-dioxygenase-like lactoylglutathione lyase family enzyme
MSTRFDLVTIDGDTSLLQAFWSSALALHEVEREDGDRWVVLADADGVRRLGLQRGHARPGGVHLDLACPPADFERERERLLGLGAVETRPPRIESYGSIANFADPQGNLFDLCAYVIDLRADA